MIDTAGLPLAVIPARTVREILASDRGAVVEAVSRAYAAFAAGRAENPQSLFLTPVDRPGTRIIALPAADEQMAALKWIASWPQNVRSGLPRASAVMILNDLATGYPVACLEGSVISASRTAASAALAVRVLRSAQGAALPRRVGFIGAGLIARYLHDYLADTLGEVDEIGVFDLVEEHADGFAGAVARGRGDRVVRHPDAQSLIRASDLVVLATVAAEPHLHEPAWFEHAPLVLHVSLRDLAPRVVRSGTNVVDDVDHCLRAATSLHRTEQEVGNRDFVLGTLDEVRRGVVAVPADRPCIFSPFGLGVLDLAVGRLVYEQARLKGDLQELPGFFDEIRRYG